MRAKAVCKPADPPVEVMRECHAVSNVAFNTSGLFHDVLFSLGWGPIISANQVVHASSNDH